MTGGGRSPYIDWSVVTDDKVDHALRSLLTVERMAGRWDGISNIEPIIHRLILRAFVATGSSPSPGVLCASSRYQGEQVTNALHSLSGRDLILLEGDAITGAFPFSSKPTRHVVNFVEQSIPAFCAIDALGAAAMLEQQVKVVNACPLCERTITIAVNEDGLGIRSVDPANTNIWAEVSKAHGCAANTQCKSILAFCSDRHLDAWKHRGQYGFRLTPAQAAQIGAAIFRAFLAQGPVAPAEPGKIVMLRPI